MNTRQDKKERIDPREVLYEKLLELGLNQGAALLIAVDAGGQGSVNLGYLRLVGVEEKALQDKILFLIMRFEVGDFGGFG
ncbi:MAG: hypothetical protein BroJett011_26560 [Chloroflexota bacterium]|nr:MAG: hypothetical protein BroJett011_26560 [Chloroflexota bacterium]